jgi:hypothetical protein
VGDAQDHEGSAARAASIRGRTAALMHLLTDLPDDEIRAAIDKLPREERARLDELAAEIFKDHADLFGP